VGGTSNPEAQRLFIEAGAIVGSSTAKADGQKALQLLDSAIALDPRYADAYARKSGVLVGYANSYANADELPRERAEALNLAKTALAIAPDLPAGHRALSSVYSSNLSIGPAYSELQRARQLAPGNADILADLADYTTGFGNIDGAIGLADQAIKLDPLNPHTYGVRLNAFYQGRRYQDAVDYGQSVFQKFPKGQNNAMIVADSLVLLGRNQEAQNWYNVAAPDYWRRLTGETILHIRSGDRAGGQQKLDRLRQLFGDAASTQFGEIYAQMGDKDRAFAALNRAFEIKDAGLLAAKVDPFLDPLRSDPRFAAFLAKMNFPS
jgi:serine/threonine-protein kinase